MLLHPDPRLAEVPGFTRAQLDALASSVELRRQQLEADIQDYITRKQDELRQHEQELVERCRSMECRLPPAAAAKFSMRNAEDIATWPASQDPSALFAPDAREPEPEPEERTRQKKHTRVHKREKELYGLVTPVFLPLLESRDRSPPKKKEKRQAKTKQSTKEAKDMVEGVVSGEPGTENQPTEAAKKAKRAVLKKSSLRHKDAPRSRRKRVSLVIDGQTVLPADTIIEPTLSSPTSETTSASNSTASLDDMIDPRLTSHIPPVSLEHRDAVHHSLPNAMLNAFHSPTKPRAETPPATTIPPEHSPPSPRSPSIPFGPVQTAMRTFLGPSPTQAPTSIPETASPNPIYSTATSTSAELETDDLLDEERQWDTYVGGMHGSGVDDVDQAGSYGYPSSLGASYLESYMQNRPLSVRMQAADKAGLDAKEKRKLLEDKNEEEEDIGVERDTCRNRVGDADEENFMGDMEDF
ncbi:hypothetical protein EJ02DRAFT_454487 [Clathrospora elynae]|uniref:Uncharacterized protein n=1 Tax=Clathrospora elynae TaxID=706981 RepID=A0A6A5SNW0_9PLEO|nr:hypothetical protein EJ02DRAFT_454487 [Clathrospora elynae]